MIRLVSSFQLKKISLKVTDMKIKIIVQICLHPYNSQNIEKWPLLPQAYLDIRLNDIGITTQTEHVCKSSIIVWHSWTLFIIVNNLAFFSQLVCNWTQWVFPLIFSISEHEKRDLASHIHTYILHFKCATHILKTIAKEFLK